MKKQEGEFLIKRDKVRKHLIMTRLGLKNQTYQKIMGQLSNGKHNQPFNDNEVNSIHEGLQTVIDVCKDFQGELKRPDSEDPTTRGEFKKLKQSHVYRKD